MPCTVKALTGARYYANKEGADYRSRLRYATAGDDEKMFVPSTRILYYAGRDGGIGRTTLILKFMNDWLGKIVVPTATNVNPYSQAISSHIKNMLSKNILVSKREMLTDEDLEYYRVCYLANRQLREGGRLDEKVSICGREYKIEGMEVDQILEITNPAFFLSGCLLTDPIKVATAASRTGYFKTTVMNVYSLLSCCKLTKTENHEHCFKDAETAVKFLGKFEDFKKVYNDKLQKFLETMKMKEDGASYVEISRKIGVRYDTVRSWCKGATPGGLALPKKSFGLLGLEKSLYGEFEKYGLFAQGEEEDDFS
jgi:hypothetical protein